MTLKAEYTKHGFILSSGVFSEEEVERALTLCADLPRSQRAKQNNRNLQRIQPLQRVTEFKDPQWINNFYQAPRLKQLLSSLFTDVITPTPDMSRDYQITGLLIEPLDRDWSTGLHRDYRDLVPNLDVDLWWQTNQDYRCFNQLNIPLFPDHCLWVIPGSHSRPDSRPESQLVDRRSEFLNPRDVPNASSDVEPTQDELEKKLIELGAVQIKANPGDVILYRSSLLHCGIYSKKTRRMTLHDGVYSKQWHEYVLKTFAQ